MTDSSSLLWWLLPGELAGMPMPYLDPMRRFQGTAALEDFADELPVLHAAGVRSVVCLLNIQSDLATYRSAGFDILVSPIPNYQAPSLQQMQEILTFMRQAPKAIAVHCEGGIGRTGTVLAAYLIERGMSANDAISAVREIEPAAIETLSQEAFLHEFARSSGS